MVTLHVGFFRNTIYLSTQKMHLVRFYKFSKSFWRLLMSPPPVHVKIDVRNYIPNIHARQSDDVNWWSLHVAFYFL